MSSQSLSAYTDDATAKYAGLQLRGEKRFANGLSVQANYTWASAFDYGNTYFFWDRHVDYGRSSNVRRHVFNLNHVYELPFGRGHAFFKDASGPVDYLIGGWQLSGVWLWGTGMPFTPCFRVEKIDYRSFRGSLSGLSFAYCDFYQRNPRSHLISSSAEQSTAPASPVANVRPALRPSLAQ